jgi:tight adherence protein B
MSLASARRGLRAVAAACIALALLFVVAPPPANAQASANRVEFVEVNSTDPANVQIVFRYDGPAADVDNATLAENTTTVDAAKPTSLTAANRPQGVVFVFDTSSTTDGNGTLAEGRAAVRALLPKLAKGTQVSVIAAGNDALVVQRFTTDSAAIEKALNGLTPQGDSALWEGVSRAADQISGQSSMVGSIVLITDGNSDKGSTFANAKGLALEAGASVFVIGVDDGKLGSEPQGIADATGGSYASTQKASETTKLLDGFAGGLNGLYVTSYKSATTKGVNDLSLSIGGVSTKASYIVGSDARGPSALAFQPAESTSGVKSLQNDFGKYLGIVLGVLAAALAAYAIISILAKDNSGLASVLQPYSETYGGRSASSDDDEGDDSSMAQTAVMQRAVEITRQFAERRGFLTRVEGALERANLPLRAAEAIFFYIAAATLVTLLTAVVTRSAFVVLVVLAIVVLIPPGALNFLSSRRKSQFESMLPDTLQLLSGTLRAGYSMMQGVEAVSQEVSEPMGRELRRVVTEARLGRPLEESLDAVAERMDSPDFGWAVMAIRIQREVGGNLSELLMTVAETMTQRERLKRDVKSLTAEGRISAYVLAVLPIALGFAMYALNPDYMSALFDETIGKAMLGGGVLMMIAGFLWMQSIVKIDV